MKPEYRVNKGEKNFLENILDYISEGYFSVKSTKQINSNTLYNHKAQNKI
jgi:regulator of sigma D